MIPVHSLYVNCHMMVEEKWGYIYGTSGMEWTEAKQEALEARCSEDDPNFGMSVRYGRQWIGHTVTDCSGAIVWIWKQYGLKIPHGSSSMVRQGYIVDCSSTPKPGYAALVDPTPETPDNRHVGIVMEDGVTIFEARGAKAGCVYSRTTDAKWTKYGRFKDVDYGGVQPMTTPYYAEVTTNSSNLNVRSGPGTTYDKVGAVKKGETVTVITHGDAWDYIKTEKVNGYAATEYLTPIAASVPVPDPDPDPEEWLEDLSLVSEEGSRVYLGGKWKIEKA